MIEHVCPRYRTSTFPQRILFTVYHCFPRNYGSVLLSLASCSGCLVFAHSLGLVVPSLEADVRELLVNGDPVIVETWRLQDDPRRAHHHCHREDPEKESVQNHGNVLPILFGLKKEVIKAQAHFKTLEAAAGGPSVL